MQLSPFETVEPTELRWNEDGSVGITWDDDHESRFDLGFLREKCPCASCRGTHGPPTTLVVRTNKSGFTIGSSKPVPDATREIRSVEPVGSYAIRFTWGDGHDGGLYSYRYLRTICPCPTCEQGRTVAA